MKQKLLLETPSLRLRRFVPADTGKVFRMSQEESLRTWIPSQVYRDEAEAASVLAFLISQYDTGKDPRTVPLVFGVELKEAGELVGHVGLSPFPGAVEVGFAIERAHQRKGLATEAVGAACKWATAEFPIRKILGIAAAQNVASQGVLLRAGFVRQQEQIMPFQGSDQPVVIFEFHSNHEHHLATIANKLLARRMLEEVVNTGAVERLPEFLAADFVAHYGESHGIESARQHIETFQHCYPDLRVTVEGQVAEDDMVVTWFTMRGTHSGQWGELKPTGRSITLRGVNVQKVRDGRIIEQWGAANTFEALLEIGAIRFNTEVEDLRRQPNG